MTRNPRAPSLFLFHRATDFFACGVSANLFSRAAVAEPKSSSDLFVCKAHLTDLRAISINGWKYKADAARMATTQKSRTTAAFAGGFAPSRRTNKSAAGAKKSQRRKKSNQSNHKGKCPPNSRDTSDGDALACRARLKRVFSAADFLLTAGLLHPGSVSCD